MNRYVLFALCLVACSACEPAEESSIENAVPGHGNYREPTAARYEACEDYVPVIEDDHGGPDTGNPGFTVDVRPSLVRISQGGRADVAVTVRRDSGFAEAIEFTVEGLPPGIAVSPLTIPAGATSGAITLTAANSVGVPCPDAARVRGRVSTGSRSAAVNVTVRGPAGTLDPSFGSSGILQAIAGSSSSPLQVSAVAEQPDGKLVLTGWKNFNMSVCRVELSGEADLSFGSLDGCEILDPEIDNIGGQRIVVSEGAIYVAAGMSAGAAVARFTHDGVLDTTFGSGGWSTFFPGTWYSGFVFDMIVVDRKLVISGAAGNDSGYIARLNMDGSRDVTFATDGLAIFGMNPAFGVVALPDGRMVATEGYAMFAFTAEGAPDLSFGSDGKVPLGVYGGLAIATVGNGDVVSCCGDGMTAARFSGTGERLATYSPLPRPPGDPDGPSGEDITIAPDGSLLFAGMVSVGHHGMARRLPDGAPDPSFGTNGVSATYSNGSHGTLKDIKILRDGRYVVVGGYLARYWN